jgi:hypothetical protein
MDYISFNPTCSKVTITSTITSSQDLNTLDPTSLSSTIKTVEQSETERKDSEEDFSHLNPEEQAVLSQISKIIRGTL